MKIRQAGKVAVVGAGLAGLTAAYRLKQRGFDVIVFEATSTPGGRVQSIYRAGHIIDTGASALADSYRSYPALAAELGMGDQLASPSPVIGIVRDGNIHLFNLDCMPVSFLKTRLLDLASKWGIVPLLWDIARAKACRQLDYADLRNAAPLDNETAHAYASRRLNPQIAEYFVGPIIRTMLIADADKISKVELLSGIANIFTSRLLSLKGGQGRLPHILAQQVRPVFDTTITQVTETGSNVQVHHCTTDGDDTSESFEARAGGTRVD